MEMNGKLVKLLKILLSVVRSIFWFIIGVEIGIFLVGGWNFYKEVLK